MPETSTERYERLAEAFYRDTGMLAPGKDDVLGQHTHEQRRAAWDAWLRERANPVGATPVRVECWHAVHAELREVGADDDPVRKAYNDGVWASLRAIGTLIARNALSAPEPGGAEMPESIFHLVRTARACQILNQHDPLSRRDRAIVWLADAVDRLQREQHDLVRASHEQGKRTEELAYRIVDLEDDRDRLTRERDEAVDEVAALTIEQASLVLTAIETEREACAQIARESTDVPVAQWHTGAVHACGKIERAILARSTPTTPEA